MSDIEKSFTFLHENIAQWFDSIGQVEAKVASLQEELARVPVSSMPLNRKTGSVESIRDMNAIMESPCESAAVQSSPLASRKRKTPSVISGNASGPSKFRSRMMVVVSYDGEIQKSFEQLVRAIGTGRNLLRKGKMAAKLEAMTALAGSDDDEDDDYDAGAFISKLGYRQRTGFSSMQTRATMMRTGITNPDSTPIDLFDSTDKELEQAQSLCEKAAHQSLREGDCRKELATARQFLEGVQVTAKQEFERYTARKAKEEAERAAAPPEEPKVDTPAPRTDSIKTQPKTLLLPGEIPMSNGTYNSATKVMDIEVDDEEEDEDDEAFVMPPIRFTSRARV